MVEKTSTARAESPMLTHRDAHASHASIMRIALLSYEYPPETGYGGIGTYTYNQAHALARLGHEVHVFAGSPEAQRSTRDDAGVRVTRFHSYSPASWLLPSLDDKRLYWAKNRAMTASDMFRAVMRELRGGSFDVIEMPECGGEGAILNAIQELPTVVRFHSPAELIMPTYASERGDRLLTACLERMGIFGARALSSCSQWLADEVRDRMGVSAPITVIPNGIDLRRFDESGNLDIHAEFDLPRDKIKIFFANRLEARKGIDVVRDVIGPVLTKHPEAMMLIAGADGDGFFEREILPVAREHGCEDRVVYLGKLDLEQVRAFVKQSDIFLLASIWENAPYSLLEAMSAGSAIVASDCGGVPEMIRHELDGLIAKTSDAEQFARALDRMLRQKSLRERLGRSARQRVEARFSADRVAQRSVQFYEWAVGSASTDATATRFRAAPKTTLEIGPDNWYQAWWMRGESSGATPRLALDEDGHARIAELGHRALAFVQSLLERKYWQSVGRGDTPEAEFLGDLRKASLESAERAARGDDAQSVELKLPAGSHPIFTSGSDCTLFHLESWRIHDEDFFASWIELLTHDRDFSERVMRLPAARWILVAACKRQATQALLDSLAKVYRTVSDHARVVARDLEFIERDEKHAPFASDLDELGLHAKLRRGKAFPKPRTQLDASIYAGLVSEDEADTPLLTVVIPSFKHETYVEAAIESVLESQGVDARVLVYDDASPDGTADIVRKLSGPRVALHENEANAGLGTTLARALALVETPFVALLNSDDVFHPQRLARALEVFAKDADAQLAATGFTTIDDAGRRLDTSVSSMPDMGRRAYEWLRWNEKLQGSFFDPKERSRFARLLHANHLVTSSNIVARSEWLRAAVEEARDLKYCLDWDLFLRAAGEGSLRYVDAELLGYRIHATNTVWFDATREVDYTHELHAVVARNLVRVAKKSSRETLADMLERAFRRHGELDAQQLVVALLAGRGQDADAEAARLQEFATDCGRRKAIARELVDVRGDAWRIAEWLQKRPQVEGDRRVAEILRDEAEILARRVAETSSENTRALEVAEDASAERDHARARHEEIAAQNVELSERLRETEGDAQARARELEEKLAAVREELETRERQLEAHKKHLDDKLEESARLKGDVARLQEAMETRGAAHAEAIERERVRYGRALLSAKIERDELEESFEWRVGKTIARKKWLRKVAKSMQRFAALGAVRGGRMRARMRGRQEHTMIVVQDGRWPPHDPRQVAEVAELVARGVDARVLAWRGLRAEELPSSLQGVLRKRTAVLRADGALQRRDQKRYAAKLDVLRARGVLSEDVIARGATVAATSAAMRAKSIAALGGAGEMELAQVAAQCLDLPLYVFVDGDALSRLEELGGDGAGAVAAFGAAARVFVDCDVTRARVAALAGFVEGDARIAVAGHASYGVERAATIAQSFSAQGPLIGSRDLRRALEALWRARESGSGVRLRVVGEAQASGGSLRIAEWLAWTAGESGDELEFGGLWTPRVSDGELGRCAAVLEPCALDAAGRAGLPWIVAQAMRNEIPVLVARTDALAGVLGDAGGDAGAGAVRFYEPGDLESLGTAMAGFFDGTAKDRARDAREIAAEWARVRDGVFGELLAGE